MIKIYLNCVECKFIIFLISANELNVTGATEVPFIEVPCKTLSNVALSIEVNLAFSCSFHTVPLQKALFF